MPNSVSCRFWRTLPAFVVLGSVQPLHAAPVENLNNLKITEVVQSVSVIDATSKQQKSARVNSSFSVPDILTTGANSRAEMVAADGTVTRVGSNTVFSFSPDKREVNLEKGSVLFHSPTGKGGGTIRSASATASVLGTSIIVTATRDGGFKLLVMEGKAKATLPGGRSTSIEAGQLTFIMPGSKDFGPVIAFRLQAQVGGSNLIKGFKSQLPSLGKITTATKSQEKKIASGQAEATNLVIADTQVLETKVVDTNFIQTRVATTVAEPEGPITTVEQALNRNVTISSTTLDSNRLYSYTGMNPVIPSVLSDIASRNLLANYNSLSNVYAGKNITINADLWPRGASVPGNAFRPFVAKESISVSQGFDNSAAIDSATELQASSTNDAVVLIADKNVNVSNSRIYNSGVTAFGTGPGGGIYINNSRIVNGFSAMEFAASTFSMVDSSLIGSYSVDIKADNVSISNTGITREFRCDYSNLIAANALAISNTQLTGHFYIDSPSVSLNNVLFSASTVTDFLAANASITIHSPTLDLRNMTFVAGSIVRLVSTDGQYSTTAGVTGSVNDIGSTLRYNGTPIITYGVQQGSGFYDLLNSNISILSTVELALDGTVSKALTIDGNPNFLSWLYNKRTFALTGAQLATQAGSVFGTQFVDMFGTQTPATNYTVYAAKDITATPKAYRDQTPYDANLARFIFLASGDLTYDGNESPFGVSGTDTSTSNNRMGLHLTAGADNPFAAVAKRVVAISNSFEENFAPSNWYGLYGTTAEVNLANTAVINGGGDIVIGATSVNIQNSSALAKGNVTVKGDSVIVNSSSVRDLAAGYDTSGYTTPATGSVLSVYATNDVSITNARLGAANITLDATTISLKDVDFKSGSIVNLKSGDGQLAANANTNAAVVARKTNYISGVKYGGTALTNANESTVSGGKITHSVSGR